MDDQFGDGRSRRQRPLRPSLAAGLAAAIMASTAGVAVAADTASIDTVKGDKYRMADAVMADRITKFTDPSGDQLLSDGSPAQGVPDWTDIKNVYVAGTRLPAKLRTKMQSDHPPGASDAFYGSVATPRAKDRIVFVAVEMAKRMPANARGQLVEIGIAGNAATPLQVGTDSDTYAGVERFSLSGLFRNGAVATGDTDVVGKEPGVELEDGDYYDVESGVFGFHDARRATWYLAIPRDGDTDVVTVATRSTTAEGQVIDRLDLPGGGHFIDLRNPGAGHKKGAGKALACRALETYSGEGGVLELGDIDATLIRYTAGVDPSTSPAKAAELLAAAIDAAGSVPVALTAVGSEEEPATVQAELSVVPQGNAVSLEFEVPAGQWTFELADELELTTSAGERIFELASLTGPAGVQTGPGLDGLVAGDLSCVAQEPGADTESETDGAGAAADEDEAEA